MAVKLPVSYSSPSSASRVLPRRCFRSQQLRFAPTTSLCFGLGHARNPPHVFSARAAASAGDGTSSNSRPSSLANGDPASPSPASASIDFLTFCHRLKTTKRKGWINHGIKGPESIADHMYRMALMALIVGDLPGVNRERCIKIAIVHDIAEAIVGDITPSDGVPKSEKSRLEQKALNEMCEILRGGLRANEIKELWAEYENNSSIEANLVKDFDKVEMILQALEYESEHGKILDEFFLSTAGKFQTEIGKSWAAEVVRRRNKRLREQMVSRNKV